MLIINLAGLRVLAKKMRWITESCQCTFTVPTKLKDTLANCHHTNMSEMKGRGDPTSDDEAEIMLQQVICAVVWLCEVKEQD